MNNYIFIDIDIVDRHYRETNYFKIMIVIILSCHIRKLHKKRNNKSF